MVWCVLFNSKKKGFKEMKKLFAGLDQPFHKDWIFYLWVLSVVALFPVIGESDGSVGVINFLFGMVIQYVVFLRLPILIRNGRRKK